MYTLYNWSAPLSVIQYYFNIQYYTGAFVELNDLGKKTKFNCKFSKKK